MSYKPRSGGSHTGSGKAGYVDETLFSSNSPKGASSPKLPTIERTKSSEKVVSPMRASLPMRHSPNNDIICITQRDLERMLKSSPILSVKDVAAAKLAVTEKRETAQAVSKARKEKMMAQEDEAKQHSPKVESDKIRGVADSGTRSRAERLLEEEMDLVKKMNKMMIYSKTVTIRDAQVEEKRMHMAENDDETRRGDMKLEIDRIRALEQYEAREQTRTEERKRGACVLEEQIAERERERIRQAELRDLERIAMLRDIEWQREEELQVQIEKRIRGKQMMEVVASANEEQIQRKEKMKVFEREEDKKIQGYIKAKLLRDEEHQSEKIRIAREKEIETARLRAKQEKANDKQAEMDEIRARRYQEANEKIFRAKEAATLEHAAAMQKELAVAREAQRNANLIQRADMARVEHSEFVRVLGVNRVKEAEENQKTMHMMEVNNRHKEDLNSQIGLGKEKQKKAHQDYLEEGARMRADLEREKKLLSEIKAHKVNELEQMSIPAKYRVELEKMKIQF